MEKLPIDGSFDYEDVVEDKVLNSIADLISNEFNRIYYSELVEEKLYITTSRFLKIYDNKTSEMLYDIGVYIRSINLLKSLEDLNKFTITEFDHKNVVINIPITYTAYKNFDEIIKNEFREFLLTKMI